MPNYVFQLAANLTITTNLDRTIKDMELILGYDSFVKRFIHVL